jgi:DNA mismatch endonuclease (patch repair protein)
MAESWASSEAVRAVMRANKGRDTRPERALRSAVHGLGLRYRVGIRPLPATRRTADLVFTRAKVAVFLDGCYWHGCPQHHRPSTKNSEFWTAKIDGNRARDAETDQLLAAAGWRVIRVWEHENPTDAAHRIAEVVRSDVGI